MTDQYDINKLIAEAKKDLPPGVDGVPLLGQQVPVLQGIPVNGGLMTIHDIVELSEAEFRELFLATVINMTGAMYSPAPPPPDLDSEEQE